MTRLFPAPRQECPLEGLYLDQRLHTRGRRGEPCVYSNFITSLDGRIAIAGNNRATHMVPAATTNPRDWRLYQELAGQADLLIISGRFVRQSENGEAQDLLPVGNEPAFADIRDWRLAQGLKPQPDIAIMSANLDLPLAALQPYHRRRVVVITGDAAGTDRAASLEAAGIAVIRAGAGRQVDGKRMRERLADDGYTSIYAIAGPAVFHTLLKANIVDRLYLTTTHQLLGGQNFDTLTRGNLLDPVRNLHMRELYYDPGTPAGAGQLFGVYESAD
ncbi:MAG: dihydrofolate reductase family protein [Gammaproteobacteria bacterium]